MGSNSGERAEACLACGHHAISRSSREALRIGVSPAEALLKCRCCGLRWIDERFRRPHQYDEEYFRQDFAGGVDVLPDHLAKRLDEMAQGSPRPAKLLEVGCGHGTFLAAAIKQGWHAEGTDISEASAARVRDRLGLQIHVGNFTEIALPKATFDVIHMNHILEHLDDPVRALLRARDLLRPAGRIFIEVPNEFSALYDRLRLQLLGRWDPQEVESSHLYFFTPRSLRLTVNQSGLRITALTTARRNCQDGDSRFVLGKFAKKAIYAAERLLNRGPNIIVVARRES